LEEFSELSTSYAGSTEKASIEKFRPTIGVEYRKRRLFMVIGEKVKELKEAQSSK